MRIVFVSGNLFDGGAQRVISVVSNELAEKGHEVALLLFSRNEKEYSINEKIKVFSLADKFEDYKNISEFKRIKLIRNILKGFKPDVAVGFIEGGYGLYLSSFGLKFKKVSSARINPKYIIEEKGLRAYINKLWFKNSNLIILQTESQEKFAPKSWLKKSVVIANPVSEKALNNQVVYNDTCTNIVMAGRLSKQKNYSMAFDAMKTLIKDYPEIKLNVFGQGELQEELLAEIEEKGLQNNVFLKGWTTNTVKEYCEHDIYLMTSNFEGMPNSLMEAMAVGLPCISTDCETGPSDLIDDGINGFLVGVNNAIELAEKIKKIIEMPKEKRVEMGKLAKRKMQEEFNNQAIATKWEQAFENLIR